MSIDSAKGFIYEVNSKRRKYEKQTCEYIENLDENCIPIQSIENRFDRYYYDKVNERIILKIKNSSKFKIIKPLSNGNIQIITLISIENRTVTRSYDKLMRILKEYFN